MNKFIGTSVSKLEPINRPLTGLAVFQTSKFIYLYYRSIKDPNNIMRIAESNDSFNFEFSSSIQDYKIPKKKSKFLEFLLPRADKFDSGEITIENEFENDSSILVFYHSQNRLNKFKIGVATFDSKDPAKLLGRINHPIWETNHNFEGVQVSFIGLIQYQNNYISYWNVDDSIYVVVYPNFKLRDKSVAQKHRVLLEKHIHNPMISPNLRNHWEAFNTFNPAAVYADNKVHLLYRAQGFNYVSVVGYASSKDGIHIDERLTEPAYLPSEPFEYTGKNKPKHISHFFVSGGGYGGVEDPRATLIDGKVYMTYVAFDGVNPPRVALTSVKIDDFLNHRWLWEKSVLISPPGVVDKSAVIFPEKINGKYVIMHRIYPDILIDFVDSLDFDGDTWLKGEYKISPRKDSWDSKKLGAGAPPIKTKDGWLLIYQAVDERDSARYKIGAMILDLNNPTKVLHRSKFPILEPMEKYENEGFKAGIVYPCGAVVIDDTLYVYYGGSDSYVCVATASLTEFLARLQFSETPRLEPPTVVQIA